MTDGRIGNLGNQDWERPPPQEDIGLCDSLDYSLYTLSNIHHAPGILSDHLAWMEMIDAATVVEDDQLRDVAEDQEPPAVDRVKSE